MCMACEIKPGEAPSGIQSLNEMGGKETSELTSSHFLKGKIHFKSIWWYPAYPCIKSVYHAVKEIPDTCLQRPGAKRILNVDLSYLPKC